MSEVPPRITAIFATQGVTIAACVADPTATPTADPGCCLVADHGRMTTILATPGTMPDAVVLSEPLDAPSVMPGTEGWRCTRSLFDRGLVAIGYWQQDGELLTAYLKADRLLHAQKLGPRPLGFVSMADLCQHSRFGNHLFRYLFLKLYALRHSLDCAVPPWDGERFYQRRDKPLPWGKVPRLSIAAFDDSDVALWDFEHPPINVDFIGPFQEMPACWAPHRSLWRRLFTLEPSMATTVDQAVDRLTDQGNRPLVAIHVRRTDYVPIFDQGQVWFRPIPIAWYREWLAKLWPSLKSPVLYVATDDPASVLPAFADYQPVSLQKLSVPGMPGFLADFEIMRRADQLAMANSSFSRMAALLAADSQTCVLPNIETGRFEPYEPWTDRAFWARFGPVTRRGILRVA